ncbi:MAG: hypothetical protein NT084_08030 [Bacteroidetes bacterium]|nr:hypothetical protein [Bacteroidota bacterium]
MTYDYNNNFPPQQNWNQAPQQPEKPSSSSWAKWLIIAIVVGGLITALIFFVASLGKKFGKTISDVSKNNLGMVDSLQAISINEEYDSLYAQISRDSSSSEMKWAVDDLRNSTDSILQLLSKYQDGFNDTIKDAGTLSQFDRAWAHNYFIKTGRAVKLKHILLSYRENIIHFLPPTEQDSSLRSYLLLDELSKTMPRFLKNLGSWENIYFNQPAMNVNINFKTIRKQVRDFEKEIIERYKNIIRNSQDSGSIIVMPNGDTVH